MLVCFPFCLILCGFSSPTHNDPVASLFVFLLPLLVLIRGMQFSFPPCCPIFLQFNVEGDVANGLHCLFLGVHTPHTFRAHFVQSFSIPPCSSSLLTLQTVFPKNPSRPLTSLNFVQTIMTGWSRHWFLPKRNRVKGEIFQWPLQIPRAHTNSLHPGIARFFFFLLISFYIPTDHSALFSALRTLRFPPSQPLLSPFPSLPFSYFFLTKKPKLKLLYPFFIFGLILLISLRLSSDPEHSPTFFCLSPILPFLVLCIRSCYIFNFPFLGMRLLCLPPILY